VAGGAGAPGGSGGKTGRSQGAPRGGDRYAASEALQLPIIRRALLITSDMPCTRSCSSPPSSRKHTVPAPGLSAVMISHLHPGGNPGVNIKSISHRCHPILVACDLTKETIDLPLGFLRAALDVLSSLSPAGKYRALKGQHTLMDVQGAVLALVVRQ